MSGLNDLDKNLEQFALPTDSKCHDCVYRLSQVMLPLDPEEFGVEPGTLVVIHLCILMDADISLQTTVACTKYEGVAEFQMPLGGKFL